MLWMQSEHGSTYIQSIKKSVQSSIGAKIFIYSGVCLIHSKKKCTNIVLRKYAWFYKTKEPFVALDSIDKKIVKILF